MVYILYFQTRYERNVLTFLDYHWSVWFLMSTLKYCLGFMLLLEYLFQWFEINLARTHDNCLSGQSTTCKNKSS